jgi:glycosyltransferase involved in cell wall biosynthesis
LETHSAVTYLYVAHHYMTRNTGAPGTVLAEAEESRRAGNTVIMFTFDQLPRLHGLLLWLVWPMLVVLRCIAFALTVRGERVVYGMTGDLPYLRAIPCSLRRRAFKVVTCSHGLEIFHYRGTDLAMKNIGESRSRLGNMRRRVVTNRVNRGLTVSDQVIVMNEEERAYCTETLGLTNVVLRAPIGQLEWHMADVQFSAPMKRRVVILGGGTLNKGERDIAPIAQAVADSIPDVVVECWGRDSIPPGAESLSFVHVMGSYRRGDLGAILVDRPVVMWPSYWEGFGKALFEAMSLGCAAVAYDVGGPHDLLSNSGGGALVPIGNRELMAREISKLLGDDKLREALGKRAFRYAWQQLNPASTIGAGGA